MRPALGLFLGFIAFFSASRALAGPPYVTDDPDPTEYRHWEIYAGLEYENGGLEGISADAPFAEFNYGAMPNVQVSISLPLEIDDADDSHHYEYGGTEFGIKTRFVQESNNRPQISFYPSVVFPAAAGGHVVMFLPIWLQKSSGPWTTFGGGRLYLNPGPGNRNYTFAGAALERAISPGTTIGAELFHQGADKAGGTDTTGANVGMIAQVGAYHAILLSLGRSLHGDVTFTSYASYEFALGPEKSP